MQRKFFLLLAVQALLWAGLPAAAQKFQPKTIQFKGAPEYSDQELMAAAGVKKGTVLAFDDMKGYAQKLLDTGIFESVLFKFDGVDLTFTLAPSTTLYSIHLDNLPLTPGKELDAALHDRLPLYHGKVPSQGGLLDGVRGALEEMLAAKGIKADLTVTLNTNRRLTKESAMGFAITAPPVVVGEIHPDNASAALDPGAMEVLAKLAGSAYDAEGSLSQIETYLGNYYHDKGCLEAEIRATLQSPPVITPEVIRIPFLVSVSPGPIYKLKEIQLAPGSLIAQAEFDRQSHVHPGDVAGGQQMTENWEFLASQYHNRGYMDAAIHPIPSFDRAQGTVSFAVTVEPGPAYTMGKLTIQNGADDLRAAMLAAWKMPAGAPFNEGAIQTYFYTQGNTPLGRTFASVICRYTLVIDHETHTVDVVLRLEKRP
jgi:outer membrane protein assembly factor BamA